METNKNLSTNENNSGANTSYIDAGVHSEENREKLYQIIDRLTAVARKWDKMMNYDIVVSIGTQEHLLDRLVEKMDKELKESQRSI